MTKTKNMISKNMICIPDHQYNEFIASVHQFRKKHNWSSYLVDRNGTKTKVIFKDGKLLNYSLLTYSYLPIVTVSWVKEQEMIPVSSVGKAMASGEDVEDALEQKR